MKLCRTLVPAIFTVSCSCPYVLMESDVKGFNDVLVSSACSVNPMKSMNDLATNDTALPVSIKNVEGIVWHEPLTLIQLGGLATCCLLIKDRESVAL